MIHVNELLASMNKSMTENEGRKRKEEQISGQVANKPKRNLSCGDWVINSNPNFNCDFYLLSVELSPLKTKNNFLNVQLLDGFLLAE